MRVWSHLGAAALVLGACTSSPESVEVDAFSAPAPTFGDEMAPSLTSPAPTSTTLVPTRSTSVRGVLPDGTVFTVSLGPNPPEEVTAISARIGVDLDGSHSIAGISHFFRPVDQVEEPRWETPSVFVSPAGPWVHRLSLDAGVIDRLGADYRQTVETGIAGSSLWDFPVLELTAPFGFATDEEFSLHMQVMYDSFVVRPGCGDLAVSCSPTGAVQFISLPSTSRPRLPWTDDSPGIDVDTSILASDPPAVEPGPAAP